MKCDLNGVKIAIFAINRKNHPATEGFAPSVTRLSCNGLFSMESKLDNFCAKKHLLLVQALSLLAKPGCASGRIHSCRQIFQAIIRAA